MKALDIFLILCAIALLGISYYFNTIGNYKLGALFNICAYACVIAFGSRVGGRIYNKNQENNK